MTAGVWKHAVELAIEQNEDATVVRLETEKGA